MRAETKLWHNLKKATPQIKWTRLESSASLGLPDLLGYNKNNIFFTIELKIIYANKIRFSPHQIAFHIRHPKNTFILASAQAPSSVKLYPGAMILELRKELVGGSHPLAVGLGACSLALGSLGEKSLRAGPTPRFMDHGKCLWAGPTRIFLFFFVPVALLLRCLWPDYLFWEGGARI